MRDGRPTTDLSGRRRGRREQRRLQHQDLSRGQLLDAAEEVFGRKGFHEATLKEVAELAEFSVGSVYSFFDNKDDLFRQIFVRRGDEFMPGLREALRDEGTPLDQLHRLVDFEVGFFRRHPRFGRLYLRYSSATSLSADREIDAAMAANYAESMRLQADLFARGQAGRRVPARRPRGAGPPVLGDHLVVPGARPRGGRRRGRRRAPAAGRPARPGRAGLHRLTGCAAPRAHPDRHSLV